MTAKSLKKLAAAMQMTDVYSNVKSSGVESDFVANVHTTDIFYTEKKSTSSTGNTFKYINEMHTFYLFAEYQSHFFLHILFSQYVKISK